MLELGNWGMLGLRDVGIGECWDEEMQECWNAGMKENCKYLSKYRIRR
jgi:hypothetical protein